jgi:antitoxin (DNA-binding transcriptional repressor) of toxin-antitoxin stability system
MKVLRISEVRERVDEIFQMVQEGEIVEVTDKGKVVMRLFPGDQTQLPLKKGEHSEAWKNLERLAAKLEAYWPKDFSAVDAVRDVRREL